MMCPLCTGPLARSEHSFAGGFVVEYNCPTCALSIDAAERLAHLAHELGFDPEDAAMCVMAVHDALSELDKQPHSRHRVMGALRSYHVLALVAAQRGTTHTDRVLAVNAQRLHLLCKLRELIAEGGKH